VQAPGVHPDDVREDGLERRVFAGTKGALESFQVIEILIVSAHNKLLGRTY